MTTEPGRILSVAREPLGSGLSVAATVGASSITVDDPTPFDESGGSLLLDGNVYAYTSVDPVADVITFAPGVTMLTAPGAGELAQDYDPVLGLVTAETIAHVEVNAGAGGDAVTAVVDHSLIPLLVPGERGATGESVTIEQRGLQWFVSEVHGQQPVITSTTVQTAVSGMGTKLGAQVGEEFEGLTLTSGISNESAPAELGLFWQFPAGAVPDATTPGVSVGLRGMQFSGSGTGTVTPPTIDIFTPTGSPTGAIMPAPTQTQITASADVVELASSTQQLTLGASLELTASSSPINAGMQFGKVTGVTTTSSGGVLQTHGLGVVPTSIQVTPFMAAAGVSCRITAMTASDFTIGFFTTSTGAALPSTNVGYAWLALA